MNAEHDRDRMLDQALKQALGAGDGAPATAACLDAETLAAWMDGGLDAPLVVMAEAHVSSCERCQALVGSMARIPPAVIAGSEGRASLWRWWFAPLAAGAAAATLWMVVPGPRTSAPPVAREGTVAQAPRASAAESDTPAPSASVPAAPQPPARAAAPDANAVFRADNAPEKTRDQGVLLGEAKNTADAIRPAEAAAGLAGQPEARAADAPMPAAAPSISQRRKQAPAGDILSPDPSIRWRLGTGGSVDYSANGGRTWDQVSAGTGAEITAGSSPSPAECWLVGRGGVVLVTSDGRTFSRVSFPEAVDLVGVQATDGSIATVTTADGRAFLTDDAGRNWRQR